MRSTTWLVRATVFVAEEARNERFRLKTGRLLEVTHAIQRLILPAEELMLPAEEPGRKGHLHKEIGTCV